MSEEDKKKLKRKQNEITNPSKDGPPTKKRKISDKKEMSDDDHDAFDDVVDDKMDIDEIDKVLIEKHQQIRDKIRLILKNNELESQKKLYYQHEFSDNHELNILYKDLCDVSRVIKNKKLLQNINIKLKDPMRFKHEFKEWIQNNHSALNRGKENAMNPTLNHSNSYQMELNDVFVKIKMMMHTLMETDIIKSASISLQNVMDILNNKTTTINFHLIAIGNIRKSVDSQEQLAFILCVANCLREHYVLGNIVFVEREGQDLEFAALILKMLHCSIKTIMIDRNNDPYSTMFNMNMDKNRLNILFMPGATAGCIEEALSYNAVFNDIHTLTSRLVMIGTYKQFISGHSIDPTMYPMMEYLRHIECVKKISLVNIGNEYGYSSLNLLDLMWIDRKRFFESDPLKIHYEMREREATESLQIEPFLRAPFQRPFEFGRALKNKMRRRHRMDGNENCNQMQDARDDVDRNPDEASGATVDCTQISILMTIIIVCLLLKCLL